MYLARRRIVTTLRPVSRSAMRSGNGMRRLGRRCSTLVGTRPSIFMASPRQTVSTSGSSGMGSSGCWWAGMEEWNQREIGQAAPHYICPHTLKNIQQLGSAAESLVQVPGGVGWIVTIRMRQVIPRAAEGDPGLFRVYQGTLLHGGKHIHHRGRHLV